MHLIKFDAELSLVAVYNRVVVCIMATLEKKNSEMTLQIKHL